MGATCACRAGAGPGDDGLSREWGCFCSNARLTHSRATNNVSFSFCFNVSMQGARPCPGEERRKASRWCTLGACSYYSVHKR